MLARLTAMILAGEDKHAEPGGVAMRTLAPTIGHEGRLLAEMAGPLDTFADVKVPVLLLGGSKGLPHLQPALSGLEQALPHARRVMLGVMLGGLDTARPRTSARPTRRAIRVP